MSRGFRVGRLFGIEIQLDWSLLVIFTLVAASLGAGGLPAWHPDWSAATVWTTAIAAAVLFFVSVLVHELSHALVGRAHGVEVPRITLFVFGGVAQMREEPDAWRAELWMALAGPLTSLALGAAFIALGYAVAGPLPDAEAGPEQLLRALSPLATLLFWLGPINIVLAVFNMVPGFPLDGGRVLRAILWGATGSLERATRHASNAGRLFAWLLIGAGFAMALGVRVPFFGTGLVGGLWLVLIGWFLNGAATTSYRQLLIRESLAGVPVSRVMTSPIGTVSPELSVRELVDDHLLSSEQRAFPVVDGGRLVGLVALRDVHRLPREEWSARRVRDVMTSADRLVALGPDESAYEAMTVLGARGLNQLVVLSGGEALGLVRREDILRFLSVYGHDALRPRDA